MSFSFDTIKDFDTHISYSIPNYDLINKSIISLCDFFKDEEYAIYDLGCSTGKLLREIPFKGKKIGIDISENLLPLYDRKDGIEYIIQDLNTNVILEKSCVIISVFTLVFLRKDIRQGLIKNIYNSFKVGGAFIFFEKVYAPDGLFQDIFTFSYYDFKKEKFTNDEILKKEKDLRLIQHPNTTQENMAMIKNAGFEKASLFYKFFNFEGWVCIK